MKTKAIHNGYCLSCRKESTKAFCNRQCYLDYIRSGDEYSTKDYEKQQRDLLTDRIVKRNIYIGSKGKTTYAMMTPDMIEEKRKSILEWRYRKDNGLSKKKLIKSKEPLQCTCSVCSKDFIGKTKTSNKCSDECAYKAALRQQRERYWKERTDRVYSSYKEPCKCIECDTIFVPEYGNRRTRYCSATCQKRYERQTKRYTNWSIKRHRAEASGERFRVRDIYERDGWVCGICHKRVNNRLKYPHPMSASLDHIVSIRHGGTHTRDNVQIAHLRCNVRAGTGNVKQLLLFG